jgi:hypothetical protein
MRDDLRVGLGLEAVPLLFKLVLQLKIVLDDSVMYDDYLSSAVSMRMGIFFGWSAVCRPAGVAETVISVGRVVADNLHKAG